MLIWNGSYYCSLENAYLLQVKTKRGVKILLPFGLFCKFDNCFVYGQFTLYSFCHEGTIAP